MKLLYFRDNKELQLVKDFLDWQKINYEIEQTKESLQHSGGKEKPVLFFENNCYVGFYAIINFFEEKGYSL